MVNDESPVPWCEQSPYRLLCSTDVWSELAKDFSHLRTGQTINEKLQMTFISVWLQIAYWLPKFPIFFFGWDFNNTWFVNDPCWPSTLLYNANDPSLISFLFLYVLTESSSLFSWQCNQQTSWNVSHKKLYNIKEKSDDSLILYCNNLVLVTVQEFCSNKPDVSAECPCRRPNILPQALLTAAILAMIGRLWMTNPTSFFCIWAKLLAWPSNPNPVTSVAPCALYLCIRWAPKFNKTKTSN